MPPAPKAPKPLRSSSGSRSRKIWLILGGAVVVAVVLIVISVVSGGGNDEPAADNTDVTAMFEGVPQTGFFLGAASAPVKMIEYIDIQCPFCQQYSEDVLPTLMTKYVRPGKLRIELRVLAFLGEDSVKGGRYVVAGAEQNRAWNISESLYVNQGAENSGWVTDELLTSIGAETPGLDTEQWQRDAESPAAEQALEKADAQAEADGVSSTPSFLIQVGDGKAERFEPASLEPESFTARLDEALAEQ